VELSGQVALVTGGGRGIGRGIALELAQAGMRVAVAARTRDQVEATAREIEGLALTADVADRESVEEMVGETERRLGPIDLLVANAGISPDEPSAWEIEPEAWWRVLEVNVLGVYLCCRTVIPGMLAHWRGRIVITGSGSA
jgi:NAD(P)-dependent dehydrogenase (short-subunit alcohol dehydrogenase family)